MALVFLAATCALLVADLKRPDRFLYILLRPNWSSWLARGTYAIAVYSLMLVSWLFRAVSEETAASVEGDAYFWLTTAAGALTACYTGWLFAQARGRVPFGCVAAAGAHLLVHAALAGAAAVAPFVVGSAGAAWVTDLFLVALVAQGAFLLAEHWLAPAGPERAAERPPGERTSSSAARSRAVTGGSASSSASWCRSRASSRPPSWGLRDSRRRLPRRPPSAPSSVSTSKSAPGCAPDRRFRSHEL